MSFSDDRSEASDPGAKPPGLVGSEQRTASTPRKRLLMVSGDRLVAAGQGGPFYTMLREFSRHFERIDVLCPRPAGPVVTTCVHDNVHFHPAAVGRAKMASWIPRCGAERIAEHGHELIVSHDYGWFYNGLGSARLSSATGVPYLSEIHHVPGHPVAADWRERLDFAVTRTYVRWARRRACAFRVVNAVEVPDLLVSWGVPRDRIVVLPSLYIDLVLFHPPPAPVDEHEFDVVFVGRMVNNKGLDRIVDALAELARRGRPARALFVGRGPLLAATRKRAERAGIGAHTRFLEWVERQEDLAAIYRSSRTVVCASTCEGGPRVTAEAMACGTPVVTTPVGMMREVVDEQNGILVDFTTASLVEGLERMLGDEAARRRMGVRAQAAVQGFEYKRVIRGYAEGLLRLASEARP